MCKTVLVKSTKSVYIQAENETHTQTSNTNVRRIRPWGIDLDILVKKHTRLGHASIDQSV